MPWDPKPQPVPQPTSNQPLVPPPPNGLPQSAYPVSSFDNASNNGQRIKTEPGTEPQYHGLPNDGNSNGVPVNTQGGLARAQQLMQQQYGSAANASLSSMQRAGGLALPGQQPKSANPPLRANSPTQAGQQFQQEQQAAMQRQQQQLAQQQAQPRVKIESDSP